MTIHIPDWVFWLLGIAGGLVVLVLAAFGVLFLAFCANWRPYG